MSRRSALALALLLACAPRAAHAATPAEELEHATAAWHALMDSPDRQVPQTLLDRCACVAVIPGVLKGALGWGARYGRGVVSCRDSAGHWSPPVFLLLAGGSVGFQIGAEKSDVVLFFMNRESLESLLANKFTLGAKAGLTAGPLGRSGEASTDLELNAEIYSYARSKGLFAGVSIEGARLAPVDNQDASFYGRPVDVHTLLFGPGSAPAPAAAAAFRRALARSFRADSTGASGK